MNVPFLVKQYLSNDLEQGSFSKIFWYYPLKKDLAEKGGIGMFFEVLYGDVDYEVYEQISKRFWDTFSENYYELDFEQALRKSIQTFTQMLRSFGVEEGLDVNIVLFNALKVENAYVLKVITFGESDLFVIRDKRVADISKLVPQNKTLRDVKFLEVDLEEGDVLLMSNKTLLQNAFDSEIFSLDSVEEILHSMDEFKENLFGSKKVFLVAALPHGNEQPQEAVSAEKQQGKGMSGIMGSLAGLLPVVQKATGQISQTATSLFARAKHTFIKSPEENPFEESIKTQPAGMTPTKTSDRPKPGSHTIHTEKAEPVFSEIHQHNDLLPYSDDLLDSTEETVPVATEAPMPVETTESADHEAYKPHDVFSEATDEAHEVPDHVDMPVPEQELSPEEQLKKLQLEEEPKLPPYSGPTIGSAASRQNINYAEEFRNKRSTVNKISKQPVLAKALDTAKELWGKVVDQFEKLTNGRFKASKIFVGKQMKAGPLWPKILIVAIVFIAIFFFIRSMIVQADTEKKAVTDYESAVGTLKQYYDQNIAPITVQDPTNELENCFTQVNNAKTAVAKIPEVFRSTESIQKRDNAKAQLASIEDSCKAKYDQINNIVRVKTANLITDLKVSLGSDSTPVDMAIKQGGLVIADAGRKSVYLVNPANSAIVKYEDTSGLITDPVSVGTGDQSTYVCDRNNGIVYTDSETEGFKRIVGLEPASIGECAIVKGFGKNVYVVPNTHDKLVRSLRPKTIFEAPTTYINGLTNVRDFVIDGNIYIVSSDDKATVAKYFAGKQDTFALEDSVEIKNAISAYTNPSDSFNIYIYDKDKNRLVAIEKATGRRHPGIGVNVRTFIFEDNDKFGDIKDMVVDLRDTGENNIYLLNGSTIWQVPIPRTQSQ